MMRKTVFYVIAFLFTATLVHTEEEYDFRTTRWNMTVEQVRNIEGIDCEIGREDSLSYLLYQRDLSGIKAKVIYSFVNNKLLGAIITTDTIHLSGDDHIKEYRKIVDILTQKYGIPKADTKKWKNDLFKGNMDDSIYLMAGMLEYMSLWETEKTMIMGILNMSNEFLLKSRFYYMKTGSNLLELWMSGSKMNPNDF